MYDPTRPSDRGSEQLPFTDPALELAARGLPRLADYDPPDRRAPRKARRRPGVAHLADVTFGMEVRP